MECPHFAGMFMKYCVAERETYVPSVYEMREYCQQEQHRVCGIYMRSDNGATGMNKIAVQRQRAPIIKPRLKEG